MCPAVTLDPVVNETALAIGRKPWAVVPSAAVDVDRGSSTANYKVECLPMKKVFTTGQVAKICKVAPRTVSKWFDSGRLRGYRIPGSQDRRIPREALIKFLKEYGMPLG